MLGYVLLLASVTEPPICLIHWRLKMRLANMISSLLIDWLIDFIDWLMSTGWRVSERRPPTGLMFIPGVNVSVESHGGGSGDDDDDAGWGKLLTRPPELSVNTTNKDIWKKVREMDEGVRILRISIFDGSIYLLKCHKILRHGTSGFTSHPKDGVLRVFIVLKHQSPRLGLHSQPLDPVASTLTTTPPRRLSSLSHYGGRSFSVALLGRVYQQTFTFTGVYRQFDDSCSQSKLSFKVLAKLNQSIKHFTSYYVAFTKYGQYK
jgi:hypothetical protein